MRIGDRVVYISQMQKLQIKMYRGAKNQLQVNVRQCCQLQTNIFLFSFKIAETKPIYQKMPYKCIPC